MKSLFLLCLLFLCTIFTIVPQLSAALVFPRAFLIDCGSSQETNAGDLRWIPDDGFIKVGNKTTIQTPSLLPGLSSLRFFPDTSAIKYCYTLPVVRGARYLVRTTYFYGNFDGRGEPPVFNQIVEGTLWSVVNTTADYSQGLSTFYEIILSATVKTLSVCLARNQHTASSPFISALELVLLEKSLYNSTDFSKFALTTVARHSFGHNGNMISFPDDPFDRYWQPFMDNHPAVTSKSNVSVLDFWNKPPAQVFWTAIGTEHPYETLQLQWPTVALPSSSYYIALYFQDNREPAPDHWRVFDISVNGKTFYPNLNVSTSGVVVYANHWPLSALTQIALIPAPGSKVGPLINAGEVFQIRELGGRTITRDVTAMHALARSLSNLPSDWNGDPCLPKGNSWTGVSCSEGKLVRVVSLSLTNFGISGSLSPAIANLTALTTIWLGGNNLAGPIPDLISLKMLDSLHLENNQFSGSIPSSLADLDSLRELFLQNNNLSGPVPDNLLRRPGLDLRLTPGNHFEGMG
ncbi:putative leucine-rich repeat receptor-like serine/threonine-protein kinase [Nymphaea thermarum]|nr:putative leucine-rich repeat receptor-like serine/threonine-protein kinase [Nymphaea thermarum]